MTDKKRKVSGRGLAHHLGVVAEAHRTAHEGMAGRIAEGIRSTTQPKAEPAGREGDGTDGPPVETTENTGVDTMP